MKRRGTWLLAITIVILLALTPFQGTDIGKLSPVEVIWFSETDGEFYLETDTGNSGKGVSVQEALENMKESATGTIFIETADYLVLNVGDEAFLEETFAFLRPNCKVCMAAEMPDMETVAAFLSAHVPSVTLRQYRAAKNGIPVLHQKNGSFYWYAE